jgi:K+/H+ antiporter YhaU regulatory subunit KhtT
VLYFVATLGIFAGGAVLEPRLEAALAARTNLGVAVEASLGWLVVGAATTPLAYVSAVQVHHATRLFARAAVPERLRGAAETTTEVLLRRTFLTLASLTGGAIFVAVAWPLVHSPFVILAVGAIVLIAAILLGGTLRRFHAEVERSIVSLSGELHESSHEALHLVEGSHAWGVSHREVTLPALAGGSQRTIGELRLRRLTGASIVAVLRGATSRVNPQADFVLEPGDKVALIGDKVALTRAEEILVGRDLGVEGGATEFVLDASSPVLGKAILEALPPGRVGATVLAIRRGTQSHRVVPALQAGDVVVVAGTDEEIQAAREILFAHRTGRADGG